MNHGINAKCISDKNERLFAALLTPPLSPNVEDSSSYATVVHNFAA